MTTPAPSPTPAAGNSEGRTIRLPWRAKSVGLARRQLVEDLEDREVPEEIIKEAELVCSELVANAIRHATPLADNTVRIRWRVRADVVEIDVSDGGGPTTPKPQRPTVWAPSGRGLRIVRSLAHEWGVQEDRTGQTVWAAVGGPSRRRAT